jgi:branched-chain amino acid transport system permease protein
MSATPITNSLADAAEPTGTTGAEGHPVVPRRRRRIRPVWYGIAVLALLTAAFTSGGSTLEGYTFTFNICLLAVLGAVALNLLMGTAGLVSIGNSAFLAVGGFGALIVMRWHIAFPADVVVAALIAGVVGMIIGLPALRLRGLYLALATLAAFFIVEYFANEYQSSASGGGSGGFILPPVYNSKGLEGAQQYWGWTLFAIIAVLLLAMVRISGERSGRAWRMIRDHEHAAAALGVRVVRYKMMAFALSSAIVGAEGALSMHLTGSLSADQFTLDLAISYIAMVLIGGLDSITGAVIGAGIVTALPVVTPNVLSGIIGNAQATQYGPAIAECIYGLLVIILITSSPRGLVGAYHNAVRSKLGHTIRTRVPGLRGLRAGDVTPPT